MNRVVIIGCGGSGKTVLARRLAHRVGAPLTHLDAVYYDAAWQPMAGDEFAHRQRELVMGDRWIIVLLTELRGAFPQVSDGFGFSSLRLS